MLCQEAWHHMCKIMKAPDHYPQSGALCLQRYRLGYHCWPRCKAAPSLPTLDQLSQGCRMQSLCVLTAPHTRTLTKNLETGQSYDSVSKLRAADTYEFATLKQLKKLLSQLASEPHKCVIRGELRGDAPQPIRRRRTCFEDVPQAWVMLDIDHLRLPKRLRSLPYTDAHAAFARAQLPAEFRSAGCCWQASASAGVDLRQLKLHLWFLLDAPLTAAQLRRWLSPMAAGSFDPATLRSVQPHYTADPIGSPYIGKRLGLLAGPRVVTPLDIDAQEPESTVEIARRPKGCADVAVAQVEGAYASAQRKARELIRNPTVAYMDAYTAGTHFGPAVALSTWNDKKHGHETWIHEAARLADKWGKRFAALPDTNQGLDVYVARVHEGIVWGLANERARLATRSQATADALAAAHKTQVERLLMSALKNAGSSTHMQLMAKKLAKYRELYPDIVEKLAKNSAFSEAQVSAEMHDEPTVALDAWRAGLLMLKDEIVATDDNVRCIFEGYPGFRESFEFNVRANTLEATEHNVLGLAAGAVLQDSLPCVLVGWLGGLGMRRVAMYKVAAVFAAFVPSFESYDPFLRAFPEALLSPDEARAQLVSIRPKLDRWLHKHLGATGDKAYVRAVAAKTLIAAVARAVTPGAQVDTMLVLMGEQGIGKTSVVRTLASVIDGGYSELLDMRDKDSILAMQSSLLTEVSELRALNTHQNDFLKAFWSRTFDRIRAPYARTAADHKRRMVFIGTTNDDDFLSDRTNRRYWPVACTSASSLTKTQTVELWREAALRYAAGEQWWLNAEEQVSQVAAAEGAREQNVVVDVFRKQLKNTRKLSLLDAINLVYPDSTDKIRAQRGVIHALKILGYSPRHTNKGNFWVRNEA